jgi:hypothetical protein
MKVWAYFWLICLLVAGGAFALITLVVSIKGVGDLRDFLSSLARKQPEKSDEDFGDFKKDV